MTATHSSKAAAGYAELGMGAWEERVLSLRS
jgi:hypothetical protein